MSEPKAASSRSTNDVSLRSLDWRFLLPVDSTDGFHHLVLLGGSTELAEQIVSVGLARQVSQLLPPTSSVDAVISLQRIFPSLTDISRALLPGGVVYFEVDRSMPASLLMGPTQLRHRLNRAGLSLVNIYGVRRDFTSRQVYLPLESRAALNWCLASVWMPSSPLWRFGVFLMQLFGRLGQHPLARLAPHYAVTAVAGSAATASLPVSGHPAWPHRVHSSDSQLLMLTPGQNDLNRVILLPFPPESRVPHAAFKFWRIPDFNSVTEHEQKALRDIHARLGKAMQDTIPLPFGTAKWKGLAVGGEQCVEGHPLSTVTNRSGAPSHQHLEVLRLAMNWLQAFQQQTTHRCTSWGDSEITQWVERPLQAYEQTFSLTAGELQLFSFVRQRAQELVGFPNPIVWVHGDLSLRNLWRNGGRLIVIDWEGSHLGPAPFDLLFFITDWTKNARGADEYKTKSFGFRELFCDGVSTNWACKAAREAIAQHLNALSIDHRFLPLWVVLLWVKCALGRFDLRDSVTPPRFVPETVNHHVERVRELAIHRDLLFAG